MKRDLRTIINITLLAALALPQLALGQAEPDSLLLGIIGSGGGNSPANGGGLSPAKCGGGVT